MIFWKKLIFSKYFLCNEDCFVQNKDIQKENIKKGSLQSNKLKTINSFYYNRLPYHVQQMKELFNSSSL